MQKTKLYFFDHNGQKDFITDEINKFGYFKLPPSKEKLLYFSHKLKATKFNRILISFLKKFIRDKKQKIFDIYGYENLRLRISPYDNRCEKNAFFTPQFWDKDERNFIENYLRENKKNDFVFLDIGANIGLYSLFTEAICNKYKVKNKIIAIEPDKTNLRRMLVAKYFNNFKFEIFNCAIGGENGKKILYHPNEKNRGEIQIKEPNNSSIDDELNYINICKLSFIIDKIKVDNIDILKIDVEGYEKKIFEDYFDDKNKILPKYIILECGKKRDNQALKFCLENGYEVLQFLKINVILKLI